MKAKSDGVITRLSQQQRDPTRVNIYLDGRFAFSVSAEVVIKRKFVVGQSLSADDRDKLAGVSDEEKLFAKLVNFLSYRPRTVKEVRDRLYKYLGTGEEEKKTALIAKLDRLGYLNDTEFARWFVASRASHRPRSLRHLAAELHAKGVPKDIIKEALAGGTDEREAMRSLIAKNAGLDRNKLTAYLARRGFSWDMIKDELSAMDKQGSNG